MTETELLPNKTLLALNHAAPVEATQAVLLKHHRLLPVAALAAQQVAPADVHGRAVTHAAPGSQRPGFPIRQAEIGRLVRVDQILLVRRLDVLADGDQSLSVVASHHLGGAVEAFQQAVAHLAEMGHLLPARPQRTRARQAVALTLRPHVELHRLRGGEGRKGGGGERGGRQERGQRGQAGGGTQKQRGRNNKDNLE